MVRRSMQNKRAIICSKGWEWGMMGCGLWCNVCDMDGTEEAACSSTKYIVRGMMYLIYLHLVLR
jgi:hypothetical protein